MEKTIQLLIYIHAFFGGIGLATGIWSIAVRKGSGNHKLAGKIFSVAMLLSAGLSVLIASLPGHKNLFLLLISVFTIYLVLAGNRALTFKQKTKTKADLTDKLISGTMLLASIAMLLIGAYSWIKGQTAGMLLVFFGVFGFLLSIKDFKDYNRLGSQKNAWLLSHLGRMNGALIASITAFMVAGLNIENVIIWIAPTILGTIYISYWKRKFAPKKQVASPPNNS